MLFAVVTDFLAGYMMIIPSLHSSWWKNKDMCLWAAEGYLQDRLLKDFLPLQAPDYSLASSGPCMDGLDNVDSVTKGSFISYPLWKADDTTKSLNTPKTY